MRVSGTDSVQASREGLDGPDRPPLCEYFSSSLIYSSSKKVVENAFSYSDAVYNNALYCCV